MQSRQQDVTQLESDKALTLIGRQATKLIRKHFIVSSLYFLGIAIAVLGSGFAVDPGTAAEFHDRIVRVNEMTSAEMQRIGQKLLVAEELYRRHKGWFTCDQECTRYYQQSLRLREQLNAIYSEREALERDSKASVGAWSRFGVNEIRTAFWDAWEKGNEAARRMTMFDAIFIGLGAATGNSSSRDDSFLFAIFQILLQFLFNLTIGLLTALFMFVFEAWSIINSYGPTVISAVALFLLVICSAAAVMVTAVGGVFGGLVGGVYLMVRNAEKQARMEGRTFASQRRLHMD